MSYALYAGSTNTIAANNLHLLSTQDAPTTYDSVTCTILLESGGTTFSETAMTQIGASNNFKITIPSSTPLAPNTRYIVRITATVNTSIVRTIDSTFIAK